MSLIEAEMIEIREQNLSERDCIEKIQREFRQYREETKTTIDHLKSNISELHRRNQALESKFFEAREDLTEKEKEIKSIQEQLSQMTTPAGKGPSTEQPYLGSTNTNRNPPTLLHPQHIPPSHQPAERNTTVPSTTRLTSNSPKKNAMPSTETPQLAKSDHQLHTSQTTKTFPQKTFMLIDFNGKYLNQRRMFPTHETAKLWCPTTTTALQHIEQFNMEAPDNLVIHTGTNDLHSKGIRVLEQLKKVVESARKALPEANIILSTLLPRTDFPWTTINQINEEM